MGVFAGETGVWIVFRALSISSIIKNFPYFSHWFVIFPANLRSKLEKLIWFCYQISSLSLRSWKILGSQCSRVLTPF